MEKEFENKPVVGLHKVDPLWHLHLARPDVTKLVKNDAQSVPMIKARLEKTDTAIESIYFLRKAARATVNSCWLTSLTETDGIFSERISQ